MLRGAGLVVAVVLAACSGRSAQNDSEGSGGAGAPSNAGTSGGPTMAGNSSAMAGNGSSSGGNEATGGSGATEGGETSIGGGSAGAPSAGTAMGGAQGEAGAPTGEAGGPALECPAGCSAGSEAFCQDGGVTWVCFGPGAIDYNALIEGGCTDLATQVPRFCCPASFRPDCQ
jgi:hypothetical protein